MPSAPAAWAQNSFAAGEWSPHYQGRFDLPDYHKALALCSNAVVTEHGLWTRRSGTIAGYTNRGLYAKLFPFPFSNYAPCICEVSTDASNSWLRFWYDGQICTEPVITVSSVSGASPALVTTSTNHGYSSGDDVIFTFPSTNDSRNGAGLLNVVCTATVVSNTTFTIKNAITAANIDGSTLVIDGTVTNQVGRVTKIAAPYVSVNEVRLLHGVMVPSTPGGAAQLMLLDRAQASILLSVSSWPASPAFPVFAKTTAAFTDGPYLPPQTNTLTLSAATGAITLTAGSATFVSTDVGRAVQIYTEPAQWANGTSYNAGDQVTYGTFPASKFYAAFVANSGNQPNTSPTMWYAVGGLGQYRWAKITGYTDSTHVSATIQDSATVPNSGNVVSWALDRFNTTNGWPSCGCVFGGRLWLGGVDQNSRLDASMSATANNTYFKFSPVNQDGTITDACALSLYLTDPAPSSPMWIVPDTRGLIVGMEKNEWIVAGANTPAVITPTSITISPISTHGSGTLQNEPIRAGATLVFPDVTQNRLIELVQDTFSTRFTGNPLGIRASHLFNSLIARLAYQPSVNPTIWMAVGDKTLIGRLIGCTYLRKSFYAQTEPEVWGWHKHSLGSGNILIDLCVQYLSNVTSGFVGSTTYGLTMVTEDASNNYHVEFLQQLWDESRTAVNGMFLDSCPFALRGRDPALDSGSAGIDLYGLTDLNGKTVRVLIAGLDCGTKTVSGGKVNVAYGSDTAGLLTAAYLVANTGAQNYGTDAIIDVKNGSRAQVTVPVVIGFTYTSEGQLLRPLDQQGAHTKNGPSLGELRRLVEYSLLTPITGPMNVGTSASATYPAQLATTDRTTKLAGNVMYTGVLWDACQDAPGFDGQLYWNANGPYPCTVTASNSFISTAERDTD